MPKTSTANGQRAGRHAARPRGDRAVMASRSIPDGLDDFPTPPWATRALLEEVLGNHLGVSGLDRMTVAEPCCNRMIMAEVLGEYFGEVIASDVFDYGIGAEVRDFLGDGMFVADAPIADFYITNPPFRASLEMVLRALKLARFGVAMILRTQWIEGETRYNELFSKTPPTLFAPFAERVAMVQGRWDPDADTATAYAWFVWVKEHPAAGWVEPQPPFWIPPGRKHFLTRNTDRRQFAGRGLADAGMPLLVNPG